MPVPNPIAGFGLPTPIARRFEAVMFDWDGTAVTDRKQDASAVRAAVESLCAAGCDIAVVTGTHFENIDSQLGARPPGPGRLLVADNRGSELFEIDRTGARLLFRREAGAEEDAALTRAAELLVTRLAARGLVAEVVSQRLNRRKIDLIPLPEWADPPKAQIDDLLLAVEQRLRAAGIGSLAEVAELAEDIAREAGLADPKVTSDAKHVEIGLTDKADSARAVYEQLWAGGTPPEHVLVGGDEFGELGGLRGSDAFMLVAGAADATVFSVGVEPHGVPDGVVHLPGGPERFLDVLHDQVLRRSELPRVAELPGWSLVVPAFAPEPENDHEALLCIADGVIGTNGAPLLSHPAAHPEVLAAGIYDGEGPLTDLLSGPRWAALWRALAPGDRVRRVLDLRAGVLGEAVAGATTETSVRFSSFARPGVAVLRAEVDPPESSDPLRPPLDAGTHSGRVDGYAWTAVAGSDGSITAAAWQERDATRLDRIAAYVPSRDGLQPERAAAILRDACAIGFNGLAAEHRREWSRRWENADVCIAGEAQLQLDVRLALFHLMSSVAVRGEAAVGARGLSGHGYRGHVFWDADLFVLPFLAATEPAAARAMLEYRSNRLPAALAAARAAGHRGAQFPWESAATGVDVTPRAVKDATGHTVPIRTGADEVHVVGDIAWAVCCYVDWSGDDAFAHGRGRQILVETARYWASRVRLDQKGHAHIYGVIGPDEYHEPVDDNAYTNVLARWNLRRAAASAVAVDDGMVDDVEVKSWHDIADALVDGFDPSTGVYEEFAGFFDLEHTLVRDLVPERPINADLVLGPDLVHRSQIVKQTDVLMLHHLIPEELEPGSLAANLDYYEPRTAHGSSLSLGIHAGLLARAGRLDAAVAALRTAAGLDDNDLVSNKSGGVHLGAMGSVWHALAYGFAGLRPDGDALAIDPHIPHAWSELEIRVKFRGVPMRLRLGSKAVVVRAPSSVTVVVGGRRVPCAAGETHIEID